LILEEKMNGCAVAFEKMDEMYRNWQALINLHQRIPKKRKVERFEEKEAMDLYDFSENLTQLNRYKNKLMGNRLGYYKQKIQIEEGCPFDAMENIGTLRWRCRPSADRFQHPAFQQLMIWSTDWDLSSFKTKTDCAFDGCFSIGRILRQK
jgi:hypothetical protein